MIEKSVKKIVVGKDPSKIENSALQIEFWYIFDWNVFVNSIF